MMHVLDEMSKLSVGQPANSVFISALTTSDPSKSPAGRGAEFAAELERMPLLPGAPMVETVKDVLTLVPSLAAQGSFPPINVTDMTLPCVFSQ
jgi:hypothetical protein